jgi:diacylglycerol kinase family enzyme
MRILVIINASSGKGQGNNIIPVIEERFGSSLIGIRQTRSSSEAEDIARKACLECVDIIATVGGDGTVNGVLNGIIGSDVSLGIIPVGVANDLALHLGIPQNVERACDIISARNERKLDVICANGRHYLTSVGLGLPCDVLAIAEFIKRRRIIKRFFAHFGDCSVYIIGLPSAFVRALLRRNHVRIHSPHFSINANALSLLVSNLPVLGGKYHILPAAVNDDGLGDVFLIKNSGHPLRLITTSPPDNHNSQDFQRFSP